MKDALTLKYGSDSTNETSSKGAFRVISLINLQNIGAIAHVDFGKGLLKNVNSSKQISYYFSNRNSTEDISSDHFIVTSVYEDDFVIDEFELSTDELVSFNKSSLVEWNPTGSNTTSTPRPFVISFTRFEKSGCNEVLITWSANPLLFTIAFFSSVLPKAITVAPIALDICTAARPVPPVAPKIKMVSSFFN